MSDGKSVYIPLALRNKTKEEIEEIMERQQEESASQNYRPREYNREFSLPEEPTNTRFKDLSCLKGMATVGGGLTAEEAMIYPPGESELFPEQKSTVNYEAFDDIKHTIKLPDDQVVNSATAFADLNLNYKLANNIKKCHYTELTPVQRLAIPIIQKKYDILALANTGSGKTAAFAIPIVDYLLKEGKQLQGKPQAIIIVPTRELAIETTFNLYELTFGTGIKVRVAYGGDSSREQARPLHEGCDILIGCPGRLRDFMDRGLYELNQIKFLVIDEMDRLFEAGFEEEVHYLVKEMPATRETLLFSATNPWTVQNFVKLYTHNLAELQIGSEGVCEEVEEKVEFLTDAEKQDKLLEYLNEYEGQKVLVFTETKVKAIELYRWLLRKGYKVEQLHGDMDQAERTHTFANMKAGNSLILVTTDVAQRGLDIPEVELVINYDLPHDSDNYTHRVGRTARVGHKGTAVTFFRKTPKGNDTALLNFIKQQIKTTGKELPENMNAPVFQRYGDNEYEPRYDRRERQFESAQPRDTTMHDIITIDEAAVDEKNQKQENNTKTNADNNEIEDWDNM